MIKNHLERGGGGQGVETEGAYNHAISNKDFYTIIKYNDENVPTHQGI